jgi:DNA invertase Pin-like site-specific DNA recombinase
MQVSSASSANSIAQGRLYLHQSRIDNDASGYALLQMLGMFSKLERSLTIERIKTRRKASG